MAQHQNGRREGGKKGKRKERLEKGVKSEDLEHKDAGNFLKEFSST